MRPIKFRTWDKHNEQWCYETIESICSAIYFNDTSALELPNSSCEDELPEIFCQFTGLKDKNGKEIYEGDIVEYDDIRKIVVWNEYYPEFALQDINGEWYTGMGTYDEPNNSKTTRGDMEVIGNIYENPGLL